jgi:AcrR family transcriptional regulator
MKIGRPLEYNPDQVLEAAMRLFWRQGYEATSLQDLLAEMKLSKSSLYQAFGSKRNLFLQCIKRYREITMAEMQERLLKSDSGIQFIVDTLSGVVKEVNELANPKGCLVINTASEFAQSDAQIALSVANGLDGYRDMFCQAVRKGQKDGCIRHDFESELLANYLVTNMSGLRTMVKAGTNETILERMVEVIVATVR